MSVESGYDEEVYCDPSDVTRFTSIDFDDSSEPSADDIQEKIKEWSTYIDRQTKHSWRANRVVDETHDQEHLYYWLTGHPINLLKRDIRPMDADLDDKLEVWTGNQWEEWLTDDSIKEGRENHYWLDAPVGQLWVFERAIISPHPKFRVTYRYGKDHIPKDIQMACAKLVAQDVYTSDVYGASVPGNNAGDNSDPQEMADKWWDQAHEVISNYEELSWV